MSIPPSRLSLSPQDYSSLVIQFGFVSMFSVAFPPAPLLCLLFNTCELRYVASNHLRTNRRAIARGTAGLGMWLTLVEVLSMCAVVTNCTILYYSSSTLRDFINALSGTLRSSCHPLTSAEIARSMDAFRAGAPGALTNETAAQMHTMMQDTCADASMAALFAVAIEHAFIMLKLLLRAFIADKPHYVTQVCDRNGNRNSTVELP